MQGLRVMAELLKDRYELLELLGRGGEGRVMKALDHQHNRVVALKIRTVRDDDDRDELLAEARVLLELPPHPALPLVREDFFDGDSYVIAMDFVDGIDLARLVAERGDPGLASSSVLSYLAEAADALTHLHSQHPPVIHGDIKPGNLVLTRGGRVMLVDFGMSSIPGTRRRRAGTPAFRAPELAGGFPPSRATDIYSLAATAFALLTGSPPSGTLPNWDGMDAAEARELEAALRRGLATDPKRRPKTPGELVERLMVGWSTSLPTGVMTFCLSDIEGSTALWDARPEAMARALVRHDELVASAVEARDGRFLKSMGEGDSTVSVFPNASSAVDAAIAINNAINAEQWPEGAALSVRFGLHTGEAERRGPDYFGPTLNLAARMRGQADGGEIFCSSTTAELVENRLPAGHRLVDLGPHTLKGISTPEHVFAVAGPTLAAPFASTECPYRGLLAFEADDRRLFFGREEVLESLTKRLGRGRLVAVVGASGSGKSSLLGAGLIAAARAGELSHCRNAVLITPGAECALPPGGDEDTLIVIDQFEELFTLCDETDQRARFIDAALSYPGCVVIGVRADFYGRLSEHPALAQAVTENQLLLGAMSEQDLERAITEPARLAGLKIEPGLIDVVKRDVAGAPGGLPLLSHALRATWERRDGRTLTLEGYYETGGVESAIALTADHIVDETPVDQQPILRSMFLRLTEIGDGAQETRRRVSVRELVPEGGSRAEVDAVLEQLADARLVTLDQETAEVAHEALIREWPRLRTWLDEDREGLRLHRRLGNAAQLWNATEHESTDLYRGTRLDAALEWADNNKGELNALERSFLDASVEQHDAEVAQQRRANRRLRVLLAAAAVALVVALIGGGVAVRQTNTARKQTREADIQRVVGQSGSFLDTKRDLGMLLAVEANRLKDRLDTRGALQSALVRDPRFLGTVRAGASETPEAAFSPDGRTLFLEGNDGNVTPVDVASRRVGTPIRMPEKPVYQAKVSPDGKSVFVLSGDSPTHLRRFDVATRRLLSEYALPSSTIAFDVRPDGRQIAAGTYVDAPQQSQLLVFDTENARLVRTLSGDASPQTAANNNGPNRAIPAYSTTGLLAMSTDAHTITLYDAHTFAKVGGLSGAPSAVGRQLVFSPDGTRLASDEARNGGLMLWDVAARKPAWPAAVETNVWAVVVLASNEVMYGDRNGKVTTLSGSTGQPVGDPINLQGGSICGLALTNDSSTLAIPSCNDAAVAFFGVDGHSMIANIASRGEGVGDYSTAGTMLWTADEQGVTIRDADTYKAKYRVPAANALGFTPDDKYMFVIGADGRGGRYDYGAQKFAHAPVPIPGADDISAFTFDRATGRLAVGHNDGTVAVLDEDGRVVAPKGIKVGAGDGLNVWALSFTPDGARLAISAQDENTIVFDARTGKQVSPVIARAANSTISPDGKLLVTAAFNGTLAFYDLQTFKPVGPSWTGSRAWEQKLRFSRDGNLLVTAGLDGTARLFDVESREQIGAPFPYETDSGVALRPDGRALALFMADDDHDSTRVWDLDPTAWRSAACLEAGRNLTRAEWTQYLKGAYHATCPQWPVPK